MRRTLIAGAATAIALAGFAPASADAETTCVFGGPVPGARIVRLDLPQGTDFVELRIETTRPMRPLNDGKAWHLAQGLFVVKAGSTEAAAYQIESSGAAVPRAVVERDGDRLIDEPVRGPDGPFTHRGQRPVAGLEPGTWYVVAFGTAGGSSPTMRWQSSIRIAGSATCAVVGEGSAFEYTQADFDGDQVHVPGAGAGEDLSLDVEHGGDLVVGLIDANAQGKSVSAAEVAYDIPGSSGEVEMEIEPFVSTSGAYHFEAEYAGAYPVVLIAGAEVTL